MGKDTKLITPSKPTSRHGLIGQWIFDGYAYTDDERRLRQEVLTLRKASGIDEELLQTDDPWFESNEAVAFDIEESWIKGTQYKPRSRISPQKFHIDFSKHKITWRPLSVLKRKIADFLLVRTQQHPKEMLNEPIHFVYLDLMQILHRLSISADAEFVHNQIPRLSQYIQQISTLLSNQKASDKLFIDNCRTALKTFSKDVIMKQLDSNQLSTILSQIQVSLEDLGEHYHTILHFAFISERVNDHPYWELFEEGKKPDEHHLFPTSISQNCLNGHEADFGARTLFSSALPHCPELPLHPDLTDTQKQNYLKCVKQLEELIHFKHILQQLARLIEQAGEVITITVFREDLLALFEDIDQFFFEAHHNLVKIIKENDALYSDSIFQRHTLPWWSKIMSNREAILSDYIYNQDQLSRFSINEQNLSERYKTATELLYKITGQLRTSMISSDERVRATNQLASQLLDAIYHWRLHQAHYFGLPMPQEPKLLALAAGKQRDKAKPPVKEEPLLSLAVATGAADEAVTQFAGPQASMLSPESDLHLLPTSHTKSVRFFEHNSSEHLAPYGNDARQRDSSPPTLANPSMLLLGVAIPGFFILMLLVICLLYKRNTTPAMHIESDKETESDSRLLN